MEINLNIELTENQERLLIEIDVSGCYEPEDVDEDDEADLHVLCDLSLVDTILGEQFYISAVGRQYVEKLIDGNNK